MRIIIILLFLVSCNYNTVDDNTIIRNEFEISYINSVDTIVADYYVIEDYITDWGWTIRFFCDDRVVAFYNLEDDWVQGKMNIRILDSWPVK